MPAGNIGELGIAKQTVKGTAATAAAFRVYTQGEQLLPVREVNDLEETSSGRLRNRQFVSQTRAEGAPTIWARPDSIGLILYLALGAKAVTGASDPYTHTFTMANVQPYATIWRMLGDLLYERFVDVKVSQIVLASTAGQPLSCAVTFLGLTPQQKTSAAYATEVVVAVDAVDPFMHYDGAGAFLVETVAVSAISAMTLTLNNNLSIQQGDLVSGFEVVEGMREMTIETEQIITDRALYNRFHYGSATPADNAPPSGSTLELTSGIDFTYVRQITPARSLKLAATRLSVANVDGYNANSGGDPLKATNTYKALQPSGGATALTATLKNATASY